MADKSIYLVTSGSYSDNGIVGVFTSEKNARLVRDAIKASDYDARIEVHELNPGVDDLNAGRKPWHVRMLRDGTVEDARAAEVSGYNIGGSHSIWRRSQAPAYKGTDTPDALTATVWARDKKHAVKIANEQRAQLIASGEWDAK